MGCRKTSKTSEYAAGPLPEAVSCVSKVWLQFIDNLAVAFSTPPHIHIVTAATKKLKTNQGHRGMPFLLHSKRKQTKTPPASPVTQNISKYLPLLFRCPIHIGKNCMHLQNRWKTLYLNLPPPPSQRAPQARRLLFPHSLRQTTKNNFRHKTTQTSPLRTLCTDFEYTSIPPLHRVLHAPKHHRSPRPLPALSILCVYVCSSRPHLSRRHSAFMSPTHVSTLSSPFSSDAHYCRSPKTKPLPSPLT